jgi:hypothetical protein
MQPQKNAVQGFGQKAEKSRIRGSANFYQKFAITKKLAFANIRCNNNKSSSSSFFVICFSLSIYNYNNSQ